MGFRDGNGISWNKRKQFAPHPRQITTPTPHHSIFTGRMLFLTPKQQCQRTEGVTTRSQVSEKTHTHTRLMALCPGLPG